MKYIKLKNVITLLLVSMLIISLTACGKSSDKSNTAKSTSVPKALKLKPNQ